MGTTDLFFRFISRYSGFSGSAKLMNCMTIDLLATV